MCDAVVMCVWNVYEQSDFMEPVKINVALDNIIDTGDAYPTSSYKAG